jgi:hypothetical protein
LCPKANLQYRKQYIYKENKSRNGLTDRRSLSVGPVVLTDRKGALAVRQPQCRSVTAGLANRLPNWLANRNSNIAFTDQDESIPNA